MKYRADITVMPLKELLDPQGKAVLHGLDNLNLRNVSNVRIGKHIMLELDANGEAEARQQVETACKKLLANPVMEYFEFNLTPVEESVSAS
jgi:phosphoribosylformylglycinamidine synthase subunit PurS